ncbi:hypothetical protein, partial [Nocardia abscessus]|uniref:hypothetical protein n=1 Tax=Nocardia abscessus TaxID=120957 RepID=UPI002455CEAA
GLRLSGGGFVFLLGRGGGGRAGGRRGPRDGFAGYCRAEAEPVPLMEIWGLPSQPQGSPQLGGTSVSTRPSRSSRTVADACAGYPQSGHFAK